MLWPAGSRRKAKICVSDPLKFGRGHCGEPPLCAFRFKIDIVDTFIHASRAACLTCTNKLPRPPTWRATQSEKEMKES